MRFLCTAALFLLTSTPLLASQIAVTSYTHSGADGGFYIDSTGVELIDGVDANIAWGNGNVFGPEAVLALVGWQLTDPTIEFQFAASATVGSLEVWLADSDGAAGVALPSAVTVSTSGGYSQTFSLDDPPGAGAMIPVVITGLGFTSDNVTLSFARTQTWTMLSEVRFFAIPEPATLALLLLTLAWAAGRRSLR